MWIPKVIRNTCTLIFVDNRKKLFPNDELRRREGGLLPIFLAFPGNIHSLYSCVGWIGWKAHSLSRVDRSSSQTEKSIFHHFLNNFSPHRFTCFTQSYFRFHWAWATHVLKHFSLRKRVALFNQQQI